MIRAAGLAWDIRKAEPYSSYEKFDFDVPVYQESDVWARYRVRIEEMRQSQRIVSQALEGMPGGPWKADAPKVVLPDREKMKTQMEALIYHFKIVTEGFSVPAGEAYRADRVAARRNRLLRGQRRHGEASARVHAHAELRESAGAAGAVRGPPGGRLGSRPGQHGFRFG